MSAKHRLRTLLFCSLLEVGALFGMPMRPEQIAELMHTLNQPKVAHTDPEAATKTGASDPSSADT